MTLCANCSSIPFRKILTDDPSLQTKSFAPLTTGTAYYTHRSHDAIPNLIASAASCELCKNIAATITTSVWYAEMRTEVEMTMPVWLCFSVAHQAPAIRIHIGNSGPEIAVFGRCLGIYVNLNSPFASTVTMHRCVPQSPLHGNSLKQIDLWLQMCNEDHPQCSHVKEPMQLPTRLLDLGTLPGREPMSTTNEWHDLFMDGKCRLVENHVKKMGQYVALSYCWGTSLAYKTAMENLESHIRGLSFAELPRTLQDAILITRYLDLRYIWIDCLCIVQDDKLDWEREASCMADIYSNSYLTIAATRASHCAEGFLRPRKIKEMDQIRFHDGEGHFQLSFHSQDLDVAPGSLGSVISDPMMNEPLSKRGWTLQERLLPIRKIHFATDQTYWECASSSEMEEGDGWGSVDEDFRLPQIISGLQSTSREVKQRLHWHRLIQAYTSRNLTYPSDKLPALSGVLASIQRETNDACYAGLWKQHFLEGLLWRLQDPRMDYYCLTAKRPTRLDSWRAPSWSFVAVEGVILRMFDGSVPNYCATLEECSVTQTGANPLGELRAGFARLRGPLTVIEDVDMHEVSLGKSCGLRLRDHTCVKASAYFDLDVYESSSVLMITPYVGLVIRQVDVSQNQYVRVGIVEIVMSTENRKYFSVAQLPGLETVVML